ncbi:MAG: hypothetical protein U9Q07_05435 [Planctomycetota bacterium]|nr:hypothetical protein [Planctomycetota bacterium]
MAKFRIPKLKFKFPKKVKPPKLEAPPPPPKPKVPPRPMEDILAAPKDRRPQTPTELLKPVLDEAATAPRPRPPRPGETPAIAKETLTDPRMIERDRILYMMDTAPTEAMMELDKLFANNKVGSPEFRMGQDILRRWLTETTVVKGKPERRFKNYTDGEHIRQMRYYDLLGKADTQQSVIEDVIAINKDSGLLSENIIRDMLSKAFDRFGTTGVTSRNSILRYLRGVPKIGEFFGASKASMRRLARASERIRFDEGGNVKGVTEQPPIKSKVTGEVLFEQVYDPVKKTTERQAIRGEVQISTDAEAKNFFDNLTDAEQLILRKYADPRSEFASGPFNRNWVAEHFNINTYRTNQIETTQLRLAELDRLIESASGSRQKLYHQEIKTLEEALGVLQSYEGIQAYLHHFYPPRRGIWNTLMEKFGVREPVKEGYYLRMGKEEALSKKTPPERRMREWGQGYELDLEKSVLKSVTELRRAQMHNQSAGWLENIVARPRDKVVNELGEVEYVTTEGWAEYIGKHGANRGKRMEIPQVVKDTFETFQTASPEKKQGLLADFLEASVGHWTGVQLQSFSSPVRNLTSSSFLYSFKLFRDAFEFGLWASFQDVRSLGSALKPTYISEVPASILGLSLRTSLITRRMPLRSMHDAWFMVFNAPDVFFRRSVAISVRRNRARQQAEEISGATSGPEFERVLLEKLRNPDRSTLVETIKAIDEYNFVYDQSPPIIHKLRSDAFLRAFRPYVGWKYKELEFAYKNFRAFNPRVKMSRSERLGRIAATTAMGGPMYYMIMKRKGDAGFIGANFPYCYIDKSGMLYLGTSEDGEDEYYVYAADFPLASIFFGIRGAVHGFATEGKPDKEFWDMIRSTAGPGPAVDIIAFLLGYTEVYNRYQSGWGMAGAYMRSMMPFHRDMEKIKHLDDPQIVSGDGFWFELSKMVPTLKIGEPVYKPTGEPAEYESSRVWSSWLTGYQVKSISVFDSAEYIRKELDRRNEAGASEEELDRLTEQIIRLEEK